MYITHMHPREEPADREHFLSGEASQQHGARRAGLGSSLSNSGNGPSLLWAILIRLLLSVEPHTCSSEHRCGCRRLASASARDGSVGENVPSLVPGLFLPCALGLLNYQSVPVRDVRMCTAFS